MQNFKMKPSFPFQKMDCVFCLHVAASVQNPGKGNQKNKQKETKKQHCDVTSFFLFRRFFLGGFTVYGSVCYIETT